MNQIIKDFPTWYFRVDSSSTTSYSRASHTCALANVPSHVLFPMVIFSSLASSLAVLVAACSVVRAQPSPDVQRRISAAIEAAIINGSSTIDYTAFVNPFIGTGTFLHQLSDHLGPILKYAMFLPDNNGDVWFVSGLQRNLFLPANTPSICHSPGASVPFGMVRCVPLCPKRWCSIHERRLKLPQT